MEPTTCSSLTGTGTAGMTLLGRPLRPSRVIPAVSERLVVPERDEHVIGSTTASMNQPPAAGQAGSFGPPEGAQVPGLFTAEQVE